MKKKIIRLVSVLLIITIILLMLYILCQIEQYTFAVNSIEDDTVIVSHCVMVDTNQNPLVYKYYTFSLKDILLKNTMDIENLKEGDTIYVLRMKEMEKLDIAYSIEPLSNIILLKPLNSSN